MTVRLPQFLRWVAEPVDDRAIHDYAGGGDWPSLPYAQAAVRARALTGALRARGIGSGQVVALAMRPGSDLITALCGAMLAGAQVCVLPVALPFHGQAESDQRLRGVLDVARPSLVIHEQGQDLALAATAVTSTAATASVTLNGLVAEARDLPVPAALAVGEAALLQFTSGTTGVQRAVRITPGALDANLKGMSAALGLGPDERFISWLPANHDMGLVGMLLGSLLRQWDSYFMSPAQFIRSPQDYIRCASDRQASLTALPAFALDYLARRVSRRAATELDLLRLRVVVGAERVPPDTLRRFEERFTASGLGRSALCPAYGSAEATLAITMSSPAEPWRTGIPATAGERADADASPVTSCGRPLPGTTVRIVDEDGRSSPDGVIGEIVVRSPSLAVAVADASGELRSGDAGFLRDGELFVVGRFGDGVKVQGRMVFAEDLEAALVRQGLPHGGAVVLLGHRDRVTAVILCTTRQRDGVDLARRAATELLGLDAEVRVLAVAPARVRRTSSGKPQRRRMWREFVEGGLGRDGTPEHDVESDLEGTPA
jgi:acyl-CoA synthetase (AMP-forming)/AMP-acid ligase II